MENSMENKPEEEKKKKKSKVKKFFLFTILTALASGIIAIFSKRKKDKDKIDDAEYDSDIDN